MHLRGANGAGKTSLMRLLAGVAQPEAGSVTRLGPVLYIAHANALADDLSLTENLAFLAALADQPSDGAQLATALAQWGLQDHIQRSARTLSQGQRRRGTLARLSLPGTPRLWLLDEPHAALDSAGAALLDTLLAEHAASGGAALFTGHQSLALPGVLTFELSAA